MIHPVTGRNIESFTLRISQRAEDDADAGRRQHPPHVVPARVLMQRRDGADVADEEHRQDDPGRVPRAEQKREDRHVQEAEPGEPAFADAHRGGGKNARIHSTGVRSGMQRAL